MRKVLLLLSAAMFTSPVTSFACDGSVQCLSCRIRGQSLHVLQGLFTDHIGALVAIAVGGAVFFISRARRVPVSVAE